MTRGKLDKVIEVVEKYWTWHNDAIVAFIKGEGILQYSKRELHDLVRDARRVLVELRSNH